MTRSGVIALHGGGEFRLGDERFLGALLALGWDHADALGRSGPLRVAIVPTAGARGRPEMAAAEGVRAFERTAVAARRPVRAEAVMVIDAASAADPDLAMRLREADIIHLPGGDPDLVPATLRGSIAWDAVLAALDDGAILAGASAGAMALAELTWTPIGMIPGMGLVPGVAVAPHADADGWSQIVERFGTALPLHLGILGLAERTGVVIGPDGPWQVIGEGEVRWLASGAWSPLVVRAGDTIERPT
jgi:cyanophycinase